MFFLSRLEKHETLMNRMADRNSADLPMALETGLVSPEQYRTAVLSCMACAEPDACAARLDHGDPGVPDYCRNAGLLARVADRLSGQVTPSSR